MVQGVDLTYTDSDHEEAVAIAERIAALAAHENGLLSAFAEKSFRR